MRGGGAGGGPETPVRGLFVSPLTHEGLLHGQAKQGSANLHDSRSASHKDTLQLCKDQLCFIFHKSETLQWGKVTESSGTTKTQLGEIVKASGTAEIHVGNIVNRIGTTKVGKRQGHAVQKRYSWERVAVGNAKEDGWEKGGKRGANASVLGGHSGHEEVAGPWPFQPW